MKTYTIKVKDSEFVILATDEQGRTQKVATCAYLCEARPRCDLLNLNARTQGVVHHAR